MIVLAIPVISFLALRGVTFSKTEGSAQFTGIEYDSFVLTENQELGAMVEGEGEGSELMIKLFKPLKSASTLVYSIDDNGNQGKLLGQVSGIGEYSFELSAPTRGIILYDAIKEVEIEKLEFSWE